MLGLGPCEPPVGTAAAVLGPPFLAALLAAAPSAAPHLLHVHLLPAGLPDAPGRARPQLRHTAHAPQRRGLRVPRRPVDRGGPAGAVAAAAALADHPGLEGAGAADQEPGAAGGEQLPEATAGTAHGHADGDNSTHAPVGKKRYTTRQALPLRRAPGRGRCASAKARAACS